MAEGLRERSKLRRRAAIERAAMRLFAERGYDATTIADIAEAVEVSPRTVTLYFPAKLDLALSHSNAATARFDDALATRKPGETMVQALQRWLRHEFDTYPDLVALQQAMLRTNPFLRGAETDASARTRQHASSALAADLGLPTDHVAVALVGGVLSGVIAVLLELDPTRAGLAGAFDTASGLLEAAIRAVEPASPALERARRERAQEPTAQTRSVFRT